jgi:hypothetical protein
VSRLTTVLESCTSEVGQGPSFVSVDYFEIGDPMGACQIINGVTLRP